MVQEHRDVGVLGGNVAVGRMMGFLLIEKRLLTKNDLEMTGWKITTILNI